MGSEGAAHFGNQLRLPSPQQFRAYAIRKPHWSNTAREKKNQKRLHKS
jgi:hypothetical protein